jgi:hypothetical protein
MYKNNYIINRVIKHMNNFVIYAVELYTFNALFSNACR